MNAISDLLSLDDAATQPLERVGGKAHTLGRLRHAGFPVPAGFVIPANCNLPKILSQLVLFLASAPNSLWAVRSSAVNEDSGLTSYAGQFTSYLNIPASEVPDYVIRCRSAVNDPRLKAYQAILINATAADQSLAVIVQRMASVEVAGIIFTADPRTGDASKMWIEMVNGSGSAVADGTARPTLIRLDRTGLADLDEGPQSLLQPEEMQALGRMGIAVEAFLGEAQDIEWAFGEGQLAILQARPITSASKDWTRANVAEIFPEPVTPLTWSLLQGFLAGNRDATTPLACLIGGKVHLRRDLVCRSFEWLLVIDKKTLELAFGADLDDDMDWKRFIQPKCWAATLVFLVNYLHFTRRLEKRVVRFLAVSRPPTAEPTLTLAECSGLTNDWLKWMETAFRLHLYATTYAIAASRLARQEMGPSGLETRSAQIGYRLWNLACQARRLNLETIILEDEPLSKLVEHLVHTSLGEDWLSSFNVFLTDFGERCANEFELMSPRWNETPEVPLSIIRGYLAGQKDLETHPLTISQANGSHHQNSAEGLIAQREEMKHALACGYGALRQVYLLTGEQLCRTQQLENAEDIFFLSDSEVRCLIEGQNCFRESIRLRRARWEGWRRQIACSDGGVSSEGGERLNGIAVCRGVVHGVARVILSLSDNLSMRPGEILVLPNADPAWTPLFLQAAAVVCDAGGLLSHSATVVREFSIPALFNVPTATSRICDGQAITVNGDEGWVEL